MGIKHKLILLGTLFLCASAFAQQIQKKQVSAIRIDTPLKIDGILDEPVYQNEEKATDFVQLMPYNGKPSYQPTEVKIFYDDNAIYVGAMIFDNPDSIQSYITTRDDIGASDYFDVFIDPNNEGLTGYEFLVTPANSQSDCKAVKSSGGDNEDGSWDAVWQSATKINEKGWCAEFRIPYSALRFPAKENPVWGLNFFRRIRRYNSNNSWNTISAEIAGFIQQAGELHGLKNIKSPVRLSVSPYLASYAEHQSGKSGTKFHFKGGIDLKYGLSESHTLDMMLIPDFGQIQSDDEQLNLSPYEIQYNEKRQFFVEGTELFNRVGIFYSRRIGGNPKFSDIDDSMLFANEKITYNPNETQLVNATKISGRDKNGWGIGFMNAMSLPSKAEITDTITGKTRLMVTQPFTNYNVTVVEKAMNNNSYFSLINTNLSMVNNPYKANVTGTEFQLKNNKQTYQLTGKGAISYRSEAEEKTGYGYYLGINKVKGKFRYFFNHQAINNNFNPNDLGYIQRNNEITDNAQISYNIYNPFWILKNWYAQTWTENSMLYTYNKEVENKVKLWSEATFKNNWWIGLFFGHSFGTHDYYETRVENRYYKGPAYNIYELNFNTDYDKKLTFSICAGTVMSEQKGTYGTYLYPNIWWKASSQFNISYNISANQDFGCFGYVDDINRDSVFFGGFDRQTLVNTLSMSYAFNTKMKIDFRGRYYWSLADYNSYFFLNPDGSLKPYTDYKDNADVNFNAFTIDMTFKWEFAPGSQLSFVWKNDISSKNKNMDMKFGKNLIETLKSDQNNSLSLKVLYYIDFNILRKKGKIS
jgi:hypothetical protein